MTFARLNTNLAPIVNQLSDLFKFLAIAFGRKPITGKLYRTTIFTVSKESVQRRLFQNNANVFLTTSAVGSISGVHLPVLRDG